MTVLIPAYEPDIRLVELVRVIRGNCDFSIVVVDDGSGPAYSDIFGSLRQMGCEILTHPVNRGKGCALKTGFAYILEQGRERQGVVTADADGQHLFMDIVRVAQEISASNIIVLGVRRFVGRVPFRSALGNFAIRMMFTLASGNYIFDTQTGLRGFPVALLSLMLEIEGQRFEYEMNMLLQASVLGYGFKQIYIDTVYIAGNKSSHFRVLADSIRVCIPFFKFCMSSIVAAFVDFFMLFVFQQIFRILLVSVVLARALSSFVNYTLNKTVVFGAKAARRRPTSGALNYYLLVVSLLTANYLILSFLSQFMPLFWSKLMTEILLFMISYAVQRFVLFKKRPASQA